MTEAKWDSDFPLPSNISVKEAPIRRFSLPQWLWSPRHSLNSIKKRLSASVRPAVQSKSFSDSDLPRAKTKRNLRKTISLASTKSALAVATKAVPVSKWSVKLYGSEKAVHDEHLKIIEMGSFLIHPYSNFRFTWDLLCAILILFNIIFIPMELAFSDESQHPAALAFKLLSDVWFLADIILNFRTGICVIEGDSSVVDVDPKNIRTAYLKGWFAIDLIASFPVDFVVSLFIPTGVKSANAIRILRIGKTFSIVRVGRIPRLIRGLHRWEEIFNLQYDLAVSLLRLAYLVLILFLVCHWNGCLQYMVPMLYEFPNDTWVRMRGLDQPNITWWEAYSWSFFKSTSQMLCIGYSAVIPQGMVDLWMTLLSQVTGAILFAIFISNAINLMEEMDATKISYKMKVSQIQEFLAFRRIPSKMRRRILEYVDVRYLGKLFDEEQILKELSPGLRREVIFHNCAALIHSVSLFDDVSDDFVADLGEVMHFAVFTPDEPIVKEGRKAFEMYFIVRGEVKITTGDGNFVKQISDGMHFGETCLLKQNLRRAASVTAISNVYLYSLHRSKFQKVVRQHPNDMMKIKTKFVRLKEHSADYDYMKKSFVHSSE
ncbi:potassium/sodium hyperpolarization-activated cyclic nucleotide-gated channel 2-like [Clavelina lepadiformis]|uniref:potassium/sodium hyperpolarization-activated cyclic nucleotide-gated channel 2-like n=1 Tax=Clavelina lepadiformis TaxID=159417 RepID=UPI004042471F